MKSDGMWTSCGPGRSERRARTSRGRAGPAGQAVEVAGEDVAGHGGDGDDDQREGRGLAVREVLLVRPELGGEGLDTGRHQDQGGGELGGAGEKDETEGGGEPPAEEGEG